MGRGPRVEGLRPFVCVYLAKGRYNPPVRSVRTEPRLFKELRPFFLCILVQAKEKGAELPEKFQDLLQAILHDDLEVEPQYYIKSVRTFEEAGVPSEDRGLVVTMSDGSEYQITIVKSRGSRD